MLRKLLIVIFLCFCTSSAFAYTQTKFVGIADTLLGSGDEGWNAPDSVFADDGQYMRLSSKMKGGKEADQVDFTMGANRFTIPSGATIVGIIVTVEADDIQAGPVGDSVIKIIKAGSLVGTDHKVDTDDWPTSLGLKSWGTSTDLWGVSWTPAEINATDFGISIFLTEVDNDFTQPIIDYVQITIHYTALVKHATETLYPESIANFDDWDSTGSGATKVIMLTDGVVGNYIFSPTTAEIDRYEMTDMTADDADVLTYDSIHVFTTMQDNGTLTNQVTVVVVVSGSTENGGAQNLTESWVEYKDDDMVDTPGGDAWTRNFLDTMLISFTATNVGSSREVRITECSVLVFMTLVDPLYNLYYTNDAGFTSGDNFGNEMRLTFENDHFDTIFIKVLDGESTNDFFSSAGIGTVASWPTGGFTVNFEVIRAIEDPSLQLRVNAIKPTSKDIEESTPFTTAIAVDTVGSYSIRIPSHDWTTNSDSSLVQVQFFWSNDLFDPDDSVWMQLSVAEDVFQHNLPFDGGPTPDAPSDCLTTDTLLADAVDSHNDWAGIGGTKPDVVGDLIDNNYIETTDDTEDQGFSFSDNGVPGGATFDEFYVVVKTRKIGSKGRVRGHLYIASNECQTGWIQARDPGGWETVTMQFTGLPTTAGCDGAFTSTSFDSLGFWFEGSQVNVEMHITEVDMIICYTAAAGGGGQVIQIQLGLKDDPPPDLYPDRGKIWQITKDSKWRINKCDCEDS